MQSPILSVIIISHNQREELRRAIESVLCQKITYEYEIVLSDDKSVDGSYELGQEYAFKYQNIKMIDGVCSPRILSYQCDSDDCNPINRAQRASWNRCNGYKYCSGKYIAHVDGDDYFRDGSEVFERQIMMLESHPECSMCMENIWCLEKGQSIENGTPWFPLDRWKDGEIITAERFIAQDYFLLNQAFLMRRNPDVDPVALYGKRYDDSIITYHHLQFGSIVCVNCSDYVYVKYPESISASVCCDQDGWVLSCLGIIIPQLFPVWRDVYYKAKLSHFYIIVKLALKRFHLKEENYNTVKELNVFLLSAFNRRLSVVEYVRLCIIRFQLFIMIRAKWQNKMALDILSKLMN